MNEKRIYSKNADYQRLVVLKTNRYKRHRHGQFFVEGVRNINSAIENGWEIASLVYSFERRLSGWAQGVISATKTDINYPLTDALMADLSGKEDASELIAAVKIRDDSPGRIRLQEIPLLALFDRPSNHGNLGTIIRSCDFLGVNGLILTGHSADLYDPEVIAASMGSFFKLPVVRIAEGKMLMEYISGLKDVYKGFQVVGTTAHQAISLFKADFKKPTMFLIGNETEGLSRAYKEMCDFMVTIPMAESSCATSLNVGCAATVLFAEAARQREADL
ncbi:MAG: TrmH family RNA methyltransferase [Christensenellales bacterium]|jgi:tRNA G18 (ribose-2'-O)-methylase SpoU